MNMLRDTLSVWLRNPRKKKVLMIVGGGVLLLLVILCITIVMHLNIQGRYANAAEQMQEQAYQNLANMTQLFAHVKDENVDVQNKLIPALKEQYASVTSLNDALISGYGKRYAVLSEEQTLAFDAAFDEYAAAYRTATATGLAEADLGACIADVQAMIEERYAPKTDPEDEVVIIGADSDEAE